MYHMFNIHDPLKHIYIYIYFVKGNSRENEMSDKGGRILY